MLADIFPTGYHGTRLADVQPGDTVVVYGAGPVGSDGRVLGDDPGASKVLVVDRDPDRLRLAEQIGAIPIDDSKVDPVEQIKEQTARRGADKGCDSVGYQAHDPQGKEHPAMTLNRLVESVRFTGRIGVVGLFVPQDPRRPTSWSKQGKIAVRLSASSGSRASGSAPARPTSSTTTASCAT